MAYAVKEHRTGAQFLLAACDEELVGTRHEGGGLQVEVHEGFYDGERVDEAHLARLLGACTVANLVGQRCIAVAVELGLVDARHVLDIGDVQHAQVLVLGA